MALFPDGTGNVLYPSKEIIKFLGEGGADCWYNKQQIAMDIYIERKIKEIGSHMESNYYVLEHKIRMY